MRLYKPIVTRLSLSLLLALFEAGPIFGASANEADWARVTEDDRAIKIETDKLEASIAKKNPKQWMTGIEKGSSGFPPISSN